MSVVLDPTPVRDAGRTDAVRRSVGVQDRDKRIVLSPARTAALPVISRRGDSISRRQNLSDRQSGCPSRGWHGRRSHDARKGPSRKRRHLQSSSIATGNCILHKPLDPSGPTRFRWGSSHEIRNAKPPCTPASDGPARPRDGPWPQQASRVGFYRPDPISVSTSGAKDDNAGRQAPHSRSAVRVGSFVLPPPPLDDAARHKRVA